MFATNLSKWKRLRGLAKPDTEHHRAKSIRTDRPRCQPQKVAGRPSFRTLRHRVPTNRPTDHTRALAEFRAQCNRVYRKM